MVGVRAGISLASQGGKPGTANINIAASQKLYGYDDDESKDVTSLSAAAEKAYYNANKGGHPEGSPACLKFVEGYQKASKALSAKKKVRRDLEDCEHTFETAIDWDKVPKESDELDKMKEVFEHAYHNYHDRPQDEQEKIEIETVRLIEA